MGEHVRQHGDLVANHKQLLQASSAAHVCASVDVTKRKWGEANYNSRKERKTSLRHCPPAFTKRQLDEGIARQIQPAEGLEQADGVRQVAQLILL